MFNRCFFFLRFFFISLFRSFFFLLAVCFQCFHKLLCINSCKQDFRLSFHRMSAFQHSKLLQALCITLGCAQLLKNFLSSLRHIAAQQYRRDTDAFQQVIQYSCQTILLRFILAKHPWRRFIDILIAALQQGKDFINCFSDMQSLHFLFHTLRCIQSKSNQHLVDILLLQRIGNHTVEVFILHGNGSIHQISQNIGQVRIDTLHDQIPGNRSILCKRHFMQYEIPHGIHTEVMHKLIRIDGVSFGFGHLSISNQQPWMTEHLLWQRLTECHQHNWPVNRMEAQNVLTDDMYIRRPVFPIQIPMVSISVKAQ